MPDKIIAAMSSPQGRVEFVKQRNGDFRVTLVIYEVSKRGQRPRNRYSIAVWDLFDRARTDYQAKTWTLTNALQEVC